MSKEKLLYGIIGILLTISLIAIYGTISARRVASIDLSRQGSSDNRKEDILVVTGLGKVSVKPDVAYLNVGVRTTDKNAKKAQDDNKDIMEKVMTKLKSLKIDEEDIQTTVYNIWPRYSYNNGETLEGYEVENMIKITVRDIDSVGDVLDEVSKEGANRSIGIEFGILDSDIVYKQALEQAMDDAKNKAEVMSKNASMTIQKPLAIYEGNEASQVYIGDMMYDTRSMMVLDDADSIAEVPISSGELEIQANVTIVYETRQQ